MTEKYKELYELSKYIYEEELERAYRLDSRASNLMPAYAILVGVLGLIIKWYFDNGLPLKNALDYSISGLLFITTLFLIGGLFVTITVLTKMHNFSKVQLNDQMIKFFSDNQIVDIHFALAKRMKEGYEKNFVVTNAKAALFAKVYFPVIVSSILLFLSLLLIGININHFRNVENKHKGELTMVDNDKPVQPSNHTTEGEAKPNPDVEAPPLRIVTESYKPSKDEIHKTVIISDSDKPKE